MNREDSDILKGMASKSKGPAAGDARNNPFEGWPHSLFELRKIFNKLGPKGFREKFPVPFLIASTLPSAGAECEGPRTAFAERGDGERILQDLQCRYMIPVTKNDRNVFTSMVTIGRARNNDIIIRNSKISKLHAAIVVDNGSFTIKDMGSTNGTMVNGDRLMEHQHRQLSNGDVVAFWHFQAEFHLPESIVDMIKGHF